MKAYFVQRFFFAVVCLFCVVVVEPTTAEQQQTVPLATGSGYRSCDPWPRIAHLNGASELARQVTLNDVDGDGQTLVTIVHLTFTFTFQGVPKRTHGLACVIIPDSIAGPHRHLRTVNHRPVYD